MNQKKVKALRKVMKFNPHDERTYETVGKSTRINIGKRVAYQLAKKGMK